MKIKKKVILPFLSILFFTACSQSNINLADNKNTTTLSYSDNSKIALSKAIKSLNLAKGENPTIVDVGNGKPGGSFAFKLNFNNQFKTKNNAPGFDGKATTVKSFKLALIDYVNLGVSGSDITPYKLSGPFSVNKVGSASTSLILSNVNQGSYYVAVAAYADTSSTINVTQSGTNVFQISGENFALSTTGGDDNTSGFSTTGGVITVGAAPNFAINANALSTQMGIPLTLKDTFGATIEVPVTISTPGTKILSNIQLIRFYLVDSNAVSLFSGNLKTLPFDAKTGGPPLGPIYSTLTSTGNKTVTFSNIPPGTYYAAAGAFSSSVTIDNSTNITAGTGNAANINDGTNLGFFALSNNGGNGGNTGTITVGADYSVSSIIPLNLPMNLQ